MASFESKVSEIFDENPKLARKIPVVIRKLYNESKSEFELRLKNASEDVKESTFLQLFDVLFLDFYFSDLGDRFMDWVIDHYPERFTQSELEEMRAQATSYLDFYEVQDVIHGKGSQIKSIATETEGFLKDVSSSMNLVKWDIFLSRCYQFRGNLYATGSMKLLNPFSKQDIHDKINTARSEFISEFGKAEYAHFAKNNWETMYNIEREIRNKANSKKYFTKYGEFQPCEVRFQVMNIHAILDKIKSMDEFNFIQIKTKKSKKKNIYRYQFDWITSGIEEELNSIQTDQLSDGIDLSIHPFEINGNPTSFELIGNLFIDKYMARLETNSVELAEFAVNHYVNVFGDLLIFKRIIKKKIESDSQHPDEDREAEQKINIDPKMIQELEKTYYFNLLDEKIPALNNMTPREARADEGMVQLLIDWLKGLENNFERRRLTGDSTISIDFMKKELDINF